MNADFRIKLTGLVVVAALAVIALLSYRQFDKTAAPVATEEPITEVAVEAGKIVKTNLHRYVTAYGLVEPEPATGGQPPASSLVAAPVGGIVAEADCEEGQRIEAGTLLFRLDSRLADAQADKAKASLAFALKTLERVSSLARTEDASRKLLEQAEQAVASARQDLAHAEAQRELLRITSPLHGTLTKINVRPGEAVGPNTVLAEVVDLDRLIANLAVPGAETGSLSLGQSVAIHSGYDAKAATLLYGSVAFIGLQVDAKTASVPVRIALPANSGVRPGLFVRARIVVEERRERLAVPEEALVTADGQSYIALLHGYQATRKPVTIGLHDGALVEVAGDGLSEGMDIVTTGIYGLPEQTHVRIIAHKPTL